MSFNRREARRVNDEPLIWNDNFKSLHGYVPRDYLSPERRHQKKLFIAFIVLGLI